MTAWTEVRAKHEQVPVLTRSVRAIGTTGVVALTHPARLVEALRVLEDELAAIDLACSRFRDDSEISRLVRADGRRRRVSPLLFEALSVAVEVARRTGGAVDPTVGAALEWLGYDRDFEEVLRESSPLESRPRHRFGWWMIELDARRRSVRLPRGIRLDLGASAKALVADKAAQRIAHETGSGVLVSLGGDVAVAGESPDGGWAVGLALDSSVPTDQVDQVVSIRHGGLASSSTEVRKWRRAERELHHIVDPSTGMSAAPFWKLATATGRSCVEANAASTASIVWGPAAPARLAELEQPARLVRHDGVVVTVNDWPLEPGGVRQLEGRTT